MSFGGLGDRDVQEILTGNLSQREWWLYRSTWNCRLDGCKKKDPEVQSLVSRYSMVSLSQWFSINCTAFLWGVYRCYCSYLRGWLVIGYNQGLLMRKSRILLLDAFLGALQKRAPTNVCNACLTSKSRKRIPKDQRFNCNNVMIEWTAVMSSCFYNGQQP